MSSSRPDGAHRLQIYAQDIAEALRNRLGNRELRKSARSLLGRCFRWEEEKGSEQELDLLLKELEACWGIFAKPEGSALSESSESDVKTPEENDFADQLIARYASKSEHIGDKKHHEGLIPWLDDSLDRQEAFKSRIDWLVERSETAAEALGQSTRVKAADEHESDIDSRDSFELLVTKGRKKPRR